MHRRNFALVAIGILIAGPAHAACVKPSPPACAGRPSPFADVNDFDQCRKLMLSYRDGIEAYAACPEQGAVSPQQQQAARDEYQDVWSQFNRRARASQ